MVGCSSQALRRLCVCLLLLLYFFLSCFVLFRVGLLCFIHMLPLFRGYLSGIGCLCLPFFLWSSLAGCRIIPSSALIGLRFLTAVPCLCCSPSVAFAYFHFCLHSLLSWPSLSLASVSLDLFFCSGTSHLPLYPSLLSFGLLPFFLLGLYLLSSLGFGLVWFLFTFFVTRSNLSSFATGSSLWAE